MKTYKQDNMTIHNADCMTIMAGYEDNYFDLAVVDPPFGIKASSMVMGKGKNKKYKNNKKWDDNRPDDSYFKELFRVSKNQIIWGGIILIYHCKGVGYFGIRIEIKIYHLVMVN